MTQDPPFPLEGGRVGDGGGTAHRPKGRPATGSVKRARRFRKAATFAERVLWDALRKKQMNFRRQVPIGRFIADFAHHPSKLLIEIDGYYHTVEGAAERDARRDAWLRSEGFRVLRLDESEVLNRLETTVERIVAETLLPPSPALPPLSGKGEDRGAHD